jgi:hypothetical protein
MAFSLEAATMAVRPFVTRLTGGSLITATTLWAVASGVLASSSAEAAQRDWGSEPAESVLVEAGRPVGEPLYEETGEDLVVEPKFGEGVLIDDGSFDSYADGSFGIPGCCSNCTGMGCDQCCPSGLLNHCDCGGGHGKKACWIGRADALILWRNAPPDRPLVNNGLVTGTLLNANGLDSTTAAGPRFSIFRVNNCTGHAIEATYLRAANWRSQRPLSDVSLPYELAPPGIYGNAGLPFDSANVNLGSRLQSFEFNRYRPLGEHVRFLAGFRWIEWQEQFSMLANSAGGISTLAETNCFNDLYGGQIGLDANLFGAQWFRVDGLIKAGAYYNNGVQSSLVSNSAPPGSASVAVGDSPLNCAFAGEVGLTGVVPITRRIDFRFGYFGLWLSGIAQPTQQLSGQQLTPGQPAVGSVNANGSVIVQGVSLGLEGRW